MPNAVLCRKLGPPEGLAFEDLPRTPLRPGEVRVRLQACGVNFPDTLIIAGKYQYKPPLPFIPGVESAGTIIERAPDAGRFRLDEAVITRQRTGGYAEEIVLGEDRLVKLPPGLSFAEGAALLVASLTAYHALVQRARLVAGETLLVHGAGGGVGLAAVELGKHLGATVIAAASSAAKLAMARSRGADVLIDSAAGPFVEAVKAATASAGADVVYDPVGGETLTQSLRCVAWGGRVLIIGFAGGEIPALAANRILLKGCSVMGVRAGEAARRDPASGQAALGAVLAHAAAGRLRPHISHVLPLERYAEAMRLLMTRQAIGRVVLAPAALSA
jgi:NADPH:quinone reductase